jgi:hypothetical protein
MNPIIKPAENPHNLHYSSAKTDSAARLPIRHATADGELKLVEADPKLSVTFTKNSQTRQREYWKWRHEHE